MLFTSVCKMWVRIRVSDRGYVHGSEHWGDLAHSTLTASFSKSDITPAVEAIFNGLITNDKFCLSRMRYMPKMSARKGFPREIHYPSEATEQVCCSKAEIDEKTTVGQTSLHNSGSRGPASLGSSLSTVAPMKHTNRIPLPQRVTTTGESR